ncbi:hypothetical protein NE462_01385 [Blautia hominis]|uniref:hypothetical protein n=1 Tax=Blautia TaxID=572511 RepID=UPI001D05FA0C|nr:hypothetical protein [Blautia producta]MCB6722480.1 hypothetical protein [Blautia marasmi]MCQ4736242.1 hypothetical protein [Blautia hominis]MCQ5092667.1 hypothetical protein [Blautia producta]
MRKIHTAAQKQAAFKAARQLLFKANVPGGVFPKGMLRDAKQNPELAGAKHCILSIIPIYLKCMIRVRKRMYQPSGYTDTRIGYQKK